MSDVANLDILIRILSTSGAGVAQARAQIKGLAAETAAANAAAARSSQQAAAAQAAEIARLRSKISTYGRLQSSLRLVGSSMTTYVTLPTAAAAAAAGVLGYKYEKAMQRVAGINRQTAASMALYRKYLDDIAEATGRGPTELAQALYFVTSAGFEGARALAILRESARGAAVGMGDAQTVADNLTTIINAYGANNITAARAMDILTAAIRVGKAEPEDFAARIGDVVAVAAHARVPFEQLAAAIADMTLKGLSTAESVTSLNNFIQGLSKGTKQGADFLASQKTSYAELRKELAQKGLIPTIRTIWELSRKGGKDADEVLRKIVPNLRSTRAVWGLLSGDQKQLARVFREVKQSAGEMDTAFAKWGRSDVGKLEKGWAELLVQLKDAGVQLIPVASRLLGMVTGLVEGFAKLPGWVQDATLALIGLGAAAGPVATFWATMMGVLRVVKGIQLSHLTKLASMGETGFFSGGLWTRNVSSASRFATVLGSVARYAGIASVAIAGGAGLVYGLKKLYEALQKNVAEEADYERIMEALSGPSAAKLQKWSDKALGGHYVVKSGELVWQPTVTVDGKSADNAITKWTRDTAVKQRQEWLKEQRSIALARAQTYLDIMRANKPSYAWIGGKEVQYRGDETAFKKALQDYRSMMRLADQLQTKLGKTKVLRVQAQIDDLRAGVRKAEKEIARISDLPPKERTAELLAKRDRLEQAVADSKKSIQKLTRQHYSVLLEAKIQKAKTDVEKWQGILQRLKSKPHSVTVDADVKKAQAKLDAARKRLDDLNKKKANPVVGLTDNASDPLKRIISLYDSLAARANISKTVTVTTRQREGKASGGLVAVRGLYELAEEGPELVVPLTKPRRAAALVAQYGLAGDRSGGTSYSVSSATRTSRSGASSTTRKASSVASAVANITGTSESRQKALETAAAIAGSIGELVDFVNSMTEALATLAESETPRLASGWKKHVRKVVREGEVLANFIAKGINRTYKWETKKDKEGNAEVVVGAKGRRVQHAAEMSGPVSELVSFLVDITETLNTLADTETPALESGWKKSVKAVVKRALNISSVIAAELTKTKTPKTTKLTRASEKSGPVADLVSFVADLSETLRTAATVTVPDLGSEAKANVEKLVAASITVANIVAAEINAAFPKTKNKKKAKSRKDLLAAAEMTGPIGDVMGLVSSTLDILQAMTEADPRLFEPPADAWGRIAGIIRNCVQTVGGALEGIKVSDQVLTSADRLQQLADALMAVLEVMDKITEMGGHSWDDLVYEAGGMVNAAQRLPGGGGGSTAASSTRLSVSGASSLTVTVPMTINRVDATSQAQVEAMGRTIGRQVAAEVIDVLYAGKRDTWYRGGRG